MITNRARRREERRVRKLEKARIAEEQRIAGIANATDHTYSHSHSSSRGGSSHGDGLYGGNMNHSPRDIDPLIGRRREHTRHVTRHHHNHHNHDTMPFGEPYVYLSDLAHSPFNHCSLLFVTS